MPKEISPHFHTRIGQADLTLRGESGYDEWTGASGLPKATTGQAAGRRRPQLSELFEFHSPLLALIAPF